MKHNKTGEYISQLEALKKARKFFSRSYNQFDCPKRQLESGKYPKGLCKYYDELLFKGYITGSDKMQLTSNASSAVNDVQAKSKKEFRYLYFPKNSDRLFFLNSEIKALDK